MYEELLGDNGPCKKHGTTNGVFCRECDLETIGECIKALRDMFFRMDHLPEGST